MQRVVQPELLDTLPREAPEAARSRLDLRRVNWLMGSASRLRAGIRRSRLLRERTRPWRVLELGAGDVHLAARLWRRLPAPPAASRLWLLDQQALAEPAALAELGEHGWITETILADAFAWLGEYDGERFDLIYANLFVHHFDRGALRELLKLAAPHARAFVVVEPCRSRLSLAGTRLLRFLGCNYVTRHDAARSVRAGFLQRELTAAWPKEGDWEFREGPAGLFSHRFVARRNFPP
jgi:SAM-dependent methyltransferase